jgi:cytoskeletal protein RodZ
VTEQGAHRLGDVLREAREAKKLDLVRVERETKIRERYLSALERGEYRELPGSVYTKGFLRNYGAYLGLDPEYLIDLYRLETTAAPERQRVPTPPRPLAGRRNRAFVVTPGAIVGSILTILVGAFVAYLAFEIINFARTPELRITDPPGNVSDYTETEITIRGTTAPNSQVVVDNLRENPRVLADADGDFEVVVSLVPGSNVVALTSTDPVTGRASATERRTIIVVTDADVSPTPDTVALSVDEPADGASFSGPVPVSGTTAAGEPVRIAVQLVEAATPSFTVTDPSGTTVELDPDPPSTPEAVMLTADGTGAYSGSVSLAPGTWEITVSADGPDPVVRIVTVEPGAGLTGTVRIEGGDSYLEIYEDGTSVAEITGYIATDGDEINIEASDELRIRAGNAAAVQLTINGIETGVMGGPGAVVEWRFTRDGE